MCHIYRGFKKTPQKSTCSVSCSSLWFSPKKENWETNFDYRTLCSLTEIIKNIMGQIVIYQYKTKQ